MIRVPIALWASVIFALRRRGQGRAESGAFLLGSQKWNIGKVTQYVCFDQLDPNAYQNGGIALHAEGLAALWERCHRKSVQVLVDVHTHPTSDVRQSHIDRRHPMIPIVGHTALIVPNFARTAWWTLRGVGIHEYLGNLDWRTHDPTAPARRVSLSLW
jgi:proteasome lid subunit RPN8/RPN11